MTSKSHRFYLDFEDLSIEFRRLHLLRRLRRPFELFDKPRAALCVPSVTRAQDLHNQFRKTSPLKLSSGQCAGAGLCYAVKSDNPQNALFFGNDDRWDILQMRDRSLSFSPHLAEERG
ncbi:unnamed protein product [Vitrella brassicaformis CCMP3155]|uniref:Uncharacterized protein n=1 Tax=Vitrella brassicaformis (strain CCMP3155) TaxID=1169540 RepID=A0A0G4FSF7_VITBC|nr:unnamed protein product [Vitrella brassicaformis CCMP3155]|eukprot:CEM17625.1 unnamed protein product [Vitrella brassicaformis CCMP3155]